MINFKKQDEILTSAINSISILLMIVTLIYLWVGKPLSATSNSHASQRRLIQRQILDAKARSSSALDAARAKLWTGDVDVVAANVLAVLTKATTSRSLKMSAFRPQRSVALGDIVEQPYTVQISGSYPRIREVARVLDDPSSKIALRSIQVSASGEATNSVTVTLGLSAYVPGDFVSQEIAKSDARASAAHAKLPTRPKGAGHA